MKKILFALVAAAALLVGCQPKPVLVSKITLSQTTGSVVEGETLKLSAIVTPKEASNPELTWSSSNTSAATVTGDGTVTGVAEGTTTITAAATDGSNVKATCEITVAKKVIHVDAVGLNEHAITLKKDETAQLVGAVTPATATDQTLTWASDNTDVASVDGTGKVTAKAAGTAKITATSNDDPTKKDECVVTVTEPKPMFAKYKNINLRMGQNLTGVTAVWVYYGSETDYANRVDVPASSVTVTSSNTAVVTVDKEGSTVVSVKVTTVGAGTADITIEDVSGSKIVIPVTVTDLPPVPDDYLPGISLLSSKHILDDSGLGWNGNGTRYLGPGYVDGTECYHVKDLHREDDAGNPKKVYLVSQAKFDPVDVSSIQNPALYLRLYVSHVQYLQMQGTNSQIELCSNKADSEELTWVGAKVFSNWDGHDETAKFQLKDGWNTIVLPFDYAERAYGEFRKDHVCWFRMYHETTNDMTGKDIEFAVDQLRVIDWTEYESFDNKDMWFESGTGNNWAAYDWKESLEGHNGVFGSKDEFLLDIYTNIWLRNRTKRWGARQYAIPANMEENDMKLVWNVWVDDPTYFNNVITTVEISSGPTTADGMNWKWGHNPGQITYVKGWNTFEEDFAVAGHEGEARDPRSIYTFRIVFTNAEGKNPGRHSYYFDDVRIVKK